VAADVVAHKVSPRGAEEVYGVVLDADGAADAAATTTRRVALRRSRAGLDTEEVPA
jgi:N-methylhydantoinase B